MLRSAIREDAPGPSPRAWLIRETGVRLICTWTGKLPEDCRLAADAILVVAAKTGAGPRDLAEVFGGIYTLSRPRLRLAPAAEPVTASAI